MSAIEFRLLGPVEMRVAGAVAEVGPAKQRCVLAALLWGAGRPVAVDTLIERVWGADPPEAARPALYSYIARLRSVLGRAAPERGVSLATVPEGYQLSVRRDQVDLFRYQDLVSRARAADLTDERRSGLLTEALELWRDNPLADLTGEWARRARDAAEQEHIDTLATWAEVELALDRHDTVVARLSLACARHPLAEPLVGRLMIGLCHEGRSDQALAAFRRYRDQLAGELGLTPGAWLRDLELRIIQADPALAPRRRPVVAGHVEPEVPRQLPGAVAGLVGRDEELGVMIGTLTTPPEPGAPAVVAIHGPGGIGKSALALAAAHAVAAHFPDGQLYLDLQGTTPGTRPLEPGAALGRFLRALGLAGAAVPAEVPELVARFRELLAGRRVLLVLDNAADAEQLAPLLPATEGCAAVVTSRRPLAPLGAARDVGLGLLTPDQSARLLTRLDLSGRLAADAATTATLARLCGHLPLALRIAAARIATRPDRPVELLVRRLADERRRLDELSVDDLAMRACFQVSYRALRDSGDAVDQAAARAFRLFGLPDGPDLGLPATARLLDLTEDEAQEVLGRLVDAQLVERVDPGRFRLHDLLRLYSRELTEPDAPADRAAALDRVWRCYVATASRAGELIRPGYRTVAVDFPDPGVPLRDATAAAAWLEAERAVLLAAVGQAAEAPHPLSVRAVQLAAALFVHLHNGGRLRECVEINERALAVAQGRGDDRAIGLILHDLGIAAHFLGQLGTATDLLSRSVAVLGEAGDEFGAARSLGDLGAARACGGLEAEGIADLQRALAIFLRLDAPAHEAICLANLALGHARLRRFQTARTCLDEAVRAARSAGDKIGESHMLAYLGDCHLELDQPAEAIAAYQRSIELESGFGGIHGSLWSLPGLAEAHRRCGDPDQARIVGERAVRLCERYGMAEGAGLANLRLGSALADLGRADEGRARWRAALAILDRLGHAEAGTARHLLDG